MEIIVFLGIKFRYYKTFEVQEIYYHMRIHIIRPLIRVVISNSYLGAIY
jgi:hypothetical protein